MRIVEFFPSAFWGGTEQFVYDLSRQLLENGHDVMLAAHRSKVVADKVSNLRDKRGVAPTLYNFGKSFNPVTLIKFVRRMMAFRPDVVHTHSYTDAHTALMARSICRMCGVDYRVIMTRHLVTPHKRGLKYRYIYRNINRLVFVSDLCRRAFLDGMEQEGVRQKCHVILNSRPTVAVSSRSDIRKEYGIKEDMPMILFSGRLVMEKGIVTILDAAEHIADQRFILLFVGPVHAQVQPYIDRALANPKLADKIITTGFRSDIWSITQAADICVQPSIIAEAGSLSVLEAMQAGKPVIATNNGSQGEYVDNGVNGILISPEDVDALSTHLDILLNNKELRMKIGAAAKEKFDTILSWKNFVSHYEELYTTVVAEGRELK